MKTDSILVSDIEYKSPDPAQFKKFSLFEFPATASLLISGDPRHFLVGLSKSHPTDQQGGAIWGGLAKISDGLLGMEREDVLVF